MMSGPASLANVLTVYQVSMNLVEYSEELRWQDRLWVFSKGHNSHKNEVIKISWWYAKLHLMSYLHNKVIYELFVSFKGNYSQKNEGIKIS